MSGKLKSGKAIIFFIKKYRSFSKRGEDMLNASEIGRKHSDDSFRRLRGMEPLHNVQFDFPKDYLFESDLYRRLSELHECVSRLREITFITLKFSSVTDLPKDSPVKMDTSVKLSRVLKLRFEYFLGEVYIIELRFFALINWLRKKYKKTDPQLYSKLNVLLTAYENIVSTAFKDMTVMRGKHVHERLIETEKFSRLDHLAISATGALHFRESDRLAYYFARYEFNSYYIKVQKEHKKLYLETHDALLNLYDHMLDKIFKVIFTKRGKLIIP